MDARRTVRVEPLPGAGAVIHRDDLSLTYTIGGVENTVQIRGTVIAEDTTGETSDQVFHRNQAPRYRLILPTTIDLTDASHVRATWNSITLTLDTPILAHSRNGRIRHFEAVSRRIGTAVGPQ